MAVSEEVAAAPGPVEPVVAAGEAEQQQQPAEGEQQQQQQQQRFKEDLSKEPIDESLLTMVKGKAKRPSKPDDAARNAQLQLLQDEIVKLIARQHEIKDLLDSKHSAKGGSPAQQKLREQLQAVRAEWDAALRSKQRLQAEDGDKRTERERLLSELRGLRDTSRGPLDVAALEARIKELDFKLNHESLSAAEEKRTREQKERLERTDRPAAARAAVLAARLDAIKAESGALRGQMGEFDKQLDALKARREALNGELDALRARESEARGDVPALIAERKEASEVIGALRAKQNEVRDAFNAQWQEFKKLDRAWRVWAAHERVKRQERSKAEYEERQAARKEADRAARPNKFEEAVFECDQAIAFLRSVATAAPAAAAAPAKPAAAAGEAPEGLKPIKRRDDEPLESIFAGSGGKKGKAAKREAARAAGAAAAAAGAADKNKKLALSMADLKTFMKLGVRAPNVVGDAAAALEALEAKKRELEEKRDKAAAAAEEGGADGAGDLASDDAASDAGAAPEEPAGLGGGDLASDGPASGPEDPVLAEVRPAGVPAVAAGAGAKGVWAARVAGAAAAAAGGVNATA